MSTAQQAWLQKLGGAKTPDKQFIDAIIKQDQEQPRAENQAPELNSVSSSTTIARQEEKLTAEGLKPGKRLEVIS